MSVYEQLESVVLPIMERYQTDLTKHDRSSLDQFPTCPFLHYACESNTHLIMLQDVADYPKDGEWIPYLFGTADRWHILYQVTVMADYFARKENMPERYMVHHFNGYRLARITIQKACDIARNYRRQIETEFYKTRSA